MEFVLYADLTPEQKTAVNKRYEGKDGDWFLRHKFPITAAGKYTTARLPSLTKEAADELMKQFRLGGDDMPPAKSEKGDIYHFRTCSFGLNKEKL